MVNFTGIWNFSLSLYHITVETSDDPLSLDHPGIQCLHWPFRICIIWGAWCAWTSIWLRTSWTNPSPSGHLQ